MAQNSWQNQVKNVALALAIVGGLWMALSLGVSEAIMVVTSPADVNADTNSSFGGSIDFIDRIATAGVFVTLLGSAGFGLLTTSTGNPPFLNTLIRYTPIIVGLIAFTAFSTEAWELIGGNRDWASYSDATNGYILFLTSMMVAGFTSLLKK